MEETIRGAGVLFTGEGCRTGKDDVMVASMLWEPYVAGVSSGAMADDLLGGFPSASAKTVGKAACEALKAAGGPGVDLDVLNECPTGSAAGVGRGA